MKIIHFKVTIFRICMDKKMYNYKQQKNIYILKVYMKLQQKHVTPKVINVNLRVRVHQKIFTNLISRKVTVQTQLKYNLMKHI